MRYPENKDLLTRHTPKQELRKKVCLTIINLATGTATTGMHQDTAMAEHIRDEFLNEQHMAIITPLAVD